MIACLLPGNPDFPGVIRRTFSALFEWNNLCKAQPYCILNSTTYLLGTVKWSLDHFDQDALKVDIILSCIKILFKIFIDAMFVSCVIERRAFQSNCLFFDFVASNYFWLWVFSSQGKSYSSNKNFHLYQKTLFSKLLSLGMLSKSVKLPSNQYELFKVLQVYMTRIFINLLGSAFKWWRVAFLLLW